MFTTASFCWGDKAEFPNRRASQQRDMLPRGRGHPAWSGGRHSGSSSLPQVALGPLGQVSSWPSPRDVAFLSRAFALLSGMRGHPFFQILSLPCRRSRTNAPQHMSLLPPRQPLNCHLPGIHTPELKRLTECDRGLDSGHQCPRDWQHSGKGGKRFQGPTALQAPCQVLGISRAWSSRYPRCGVESRSPILRMQKLSPLPKKSELINRGTQILTPACLSFHRHLPPFLSLCLPFPPVITYHLYLPWVSRCARCWGRSSEQGPCPPRAGEPVERPTISK